MKQGWILQPDQSKKLKKGGKMKRTKWEVYSRVCGYLRPTAQWNEGKQSEWDDRTTFEVSANLKKE